MKKTVFVLLVGLFSTGNALDSLGSTRSESISIDKIQTSTVSSIDSIKIPARDSQEIGRFTRRSLTFVPLLWRLDESTQNMDRSLTPQLIASIREALVLPRFDLNSIPAALEDRFLEQANEALAQTASPNVDVVAKVMDQTLVAEIRKVVESDVRNRASGLMTEAQRNSFIVDKAKEMGYTEKEVNTVMNSAYVILPVVSNYQEIRLNESARASIDVGLIIFRIVIDGDQVKAIPLASKMQSAIGFGSSRQALAGARSQMIAVAAENLRRYLRAMPEFKINARIQSQFWTRLHMDLGQKDGVQVDDKYWVVEQRELPDGSIKNSRIGWAIVQSVGDDKQKTKLRLLGGRSSEGLALEENPKLPIELQFEFWKPTAQWDEITDFGDAKWEQSLGLRFDSRYNLARSSTIPQFFASFGLAFAPADVKLAGYSPYAAFSFEGDLGLSRRFFPFPFLAIEGGGDLTYRHTSMDMDLDTGTASVYQGHFLSHANLGASVLLGPTVSIGARIRYPLFDLANNWRTEDGIAEFIDQKNHRVSLPDLKSSRPEIGIYLNWNPSYIPFNPSQVLSAAL